MKIPGCAVGPHTDVKPVKPGVGQAKPEDQQPASVRSSVPQRIDQHTGGVTMPSSAPIRIDAHDKDSSEPAPVVEKKEEEEPVEMKPLVTSSGKYRCAHVGCGKEYDPEDNAEGCCHYHDGKPIFHDLKKEWSCCGARSYDWDDFMALPKCKTGKHEPKMTRAAKLDDLLEKGNLSTLEEILSNDEVVQELRAGSSKLVDRLCEKSSLEGMVKILTELPADGSSDNRKYVLPYVCVELISCDNDIFLDAWVHRDVTTGWSALGGLFQAYVRASESGETLNCVISGYMSRAICAILEKRPEGVASITKSMESSLKPALLALLYDHSVCIGEVRLAPELLGGTSSPVASLYVLPIVVCAYKDRLTRLDHSQSEDARPVYVPRLAKGLVEEADELVSRIVTGKIPEDTPVMGGTANVVTSLLFYLKSQGDDEGDAEDGCGEGEEDFCCYVASTPSGSGVPAVEGGEVSAPRRVAESVFAKREELTAVVAGDGEKEEDVELLTEIICLLMTAMTACSNEIVSTEDGPPTKLVGQDFLVAALEAVITRHPSCSLLANSLLELVKAMQQLGEDEVLVESLLHEKRAVEKCLAGEGGRPMGCRPQVAEILLSLEEKSKEAPTMSAAVKLESSAAEAYLSRWRLCTGMKLDLGGTIAVPSSVEEKAADDTGRSGASPSSTSLPPIVSSTTATPSTGGMLGDDSLDSPEFFQAGSHHDTSWSPTGRSPTPEWPGPVPTDWAESPDDQAWVASPTISDVKWGSSTPVGWPTEDGNNGQLDGDTVEGRNMNESIDLVGGDGSESPRSSDSGKIDNI
ncbi:Integrin beta-1-binding protein 2 [Perkinsus olseni]|uniref:Integrin beta-1-binding protein 2 n=1 Tax=Perkinsus olseni TaxID=32597 RepID=A0A7J6R464_PEROL|nr:Integrin beta-1-binding protein 2 [Perkinsus olseni]